MRRLLSISVLLAVLASHAAWGGASLSYERLIKEFPGSIRTIVSCGRWNEGKQGGTFRVIEARIFDASFLYVQWMKDDMTNAGSLVVRTTEVAPFNDDHSGLDVESITCRDIGAAEATVTVVSRDEGDSLRTTQIHLPRHGKALRVE